MPQIKISELPIMEELDGSDVLAGVDVSEQETKKTSINTILDYVNKNSDYKKLNDKPKINDVELNGNISLDDLNIPNKKLIKNITPKQDVEGTDNTFEDGLESPLFTLGGDGKSEQVVTSGANLLNLDVDNNNQSYGGMTVIIDKDNQTVNFDGSLSDNPDGGFNYFNRQFPLKEPITIEAGTYDFFAKVIDGNGVVSGADGRIQVIRLIDTDSKNYDISSNKGSIEINKASFIFEQPVTITTIQIIIYSNITLNDYKIGLYFGKQNVPYEPYTGGQPSPGPDYPQEINSIEGSVEFACRGKNLLNANNKLNGVYRGINVLSENQKLHFSGTAETNYININIIKFDEILKSGTSFYFSVISDAPSSIKFKLWGYDSNDEFVNSFNMYSENVITPDRDIVKWSLVCEGMTKNNTYDFDVNIILTRGVEKTDWEPYVEPNQVTFDLGEEKLRSVGDVKDELVVDLDTGDYYKQENIGEIVFDGSEDEGWEKYASIRDTKLFDYSFNISKVIENIEEINFNYVQNGMCNMSKMGLYNARTIHECEKEGIEFGANRFYFAYEKFSNYTLEEFKEWLNSHNIIANYILATPTTKKLGTLSSEDLAKLKTFYGYNNVTINTNLGLMNIRFTYGLDIKKYVDNKIAEISAQLIKGE